ncbi:hypothetical protein BJ912DRAFT_966026, partial [Pholiota molesta]
MNHRTTPMTQDISGRQPSTNNGRQPLIPPPQRRFRSQIPVRIPCNPERQRAIENHMRLAFQPRRTGPYTRPTTPLAARRVALSLIETQSVVKNVDSAFNVYNDRLEADLRDFRSLCGTLVAQEHREKEQWRLMCAKILKERDAARAIINAQQLASPTDGASSAPSPTLKRDWGGINAAEGRDDSPPSQASGSQPRPMRSLPNSRSPSPSSPQPLQPHSPSESHTPPPDSATSETAPFTPPTKSAPPRMTVFRASSSRSPPPIIKTEDAEEAPLPKRRRSSDFSGSSESWDTNADRIDARMIPRRAPPPSRPSILGKPTPAPALPHEFSHVDLMYVPMNGGLVCRACLLASSKASPNHPPQEPKTFGTNAPWDALREHCVRAHPDACVDVARLHPAEIFELRR